MTTFYAISRPLLLALALGLGLALSLAGVSTTHATGPGDLDTSFNGTGIVTMTTTGIWTQDVGYDVVVQPDGKIIVVGLSVGSPYCVILRLESDGQFDPTFGMGGVVTTVVSLDGNTCFGGALQADGKIVVTGDSSWGINHRPALTVIRYNQDGTLDGTFNGTGVVTTAIGIISRGNDVVVQPDGKIVVTGEGNDNDIAVVRYTDDGTLDGGFDGDGIVTTNPGGFWSGSAIALQPNGKIVVAATNISLPDNLFAVVRYNQNGSLDGGFKGGIVTTPVTGSAEGYFDLALQADGKIVGVGGIRYDPYGSDFAVIRYTGDGDLDTSFNGTGIVTTSIGSLGTEAYGVAIQPDGKIIAVGYSGDIALVRYNNNGNLDTTFHSTGIVTTSISNTYDSGEAIVLQPDGKIIVTGYTGDSDIAVVRYLGDELYQTYLPVILKN